MIISIAEPKELKRGDIVINDYGLQSRYQLYLSYVERVLDYGKTIIVGTGGHAHRVPFDDILAQVVGQAKEAHESGAYIVIREALDEVMANGGGAILAETSKEWFLRKYQKEI